jgi:hypothetical protein
MVLWVLLSAGVILINKYVLSYSGFPYPVALTCTHMAFCSLLASVVVHLGWAEAPPLSLDLYLRYATRCNGLELLNGNVSPTLFFPSCFIK